MDLIFIFFRNKVVCLIFCMVFESIRKKKRYINKIYFKKYVRKKIKIVFFESFVGEIWFNIMILKKKG